MGLVTGIRRIEGLQEGWQGRGLRGVLGEGARSREGRKDRPAEQAVPVCKQGQRAGSRGCAYKKDSHLAFPASGSSPALLTARSIIRIAFCVFCASDKTYPHCCKYTRDTPSLMFRQHHQQTAPSRVLGMTYSKFPCRRSAMGAAGSIIV
jgi:hypothetical protein